MYPIEKYKFYQAGKKIIAVSTYAGRTVRGVAVCDDADTFDLEKGKALAAARCGLKIAHKRRARAERKYNEVYNAYLVAEKRLDDMADYCDDAMMEIDEAEGAIQDLLKNM